MSIFTITANDTLTIWGRTFADLADGDASTVTFPNDLVGVKTGKNQNTIFSKNETGNNSDVILRVMRGSSDDRFLASKLSLLEKDFASFELANGSFVKRLGDGIGGVVRDVYTMKGGIIRRKPDAKDNVEGATDQGVAVYQMTFAYAGREAQ